MWNQKLLSLSSFGKRKQKPVVFYEIKRTTRQALTNYIHPLGRLQNGPTLHPPKLASSLATPARACNQH